MGNLTYNQFLDSFTKAVIHHKINWELVGFYAPDGRIYPFGTDTKVISTVFESLCAPLIKEIADANGYQIESAQQTVYPDFTLSPPGSQTDRIAIDIKTTYRKSPTAKFIYTLGSFTSFLRSPTATKNIKYAYSQYGEHWVIGFLYTRRPGVASKVYYKVGEEKELLCPYQDVEYFVQEKYKIVGQRPASGNTANIGSFPTNDINDLREGKGPFAALGKEVCDSYWRNYARTKADRLYANIVEFSTWQDLNEKSP